MASTDRSISVLLTSVLRKSQIVIEYAYRFRQSQPQSHVFWIYAANSAQFMQACQDVARKLKLPRCEEPDVDPCKLVSEWLDEDHDNGWLMIIDNADNADLFFRPLDPNASSDSASQLQGQLIDYIPKNLDSKRSMIITTRSRHVGEDLSDGESCIEVPPFSPEEAESLLRLTAKNTLNYPKLAISRLLEILGYIPLAITQASAFINRNGLTIQGYLTALEKDEQNLMDYLSQELQDPRRKRGSPNSVFRTWSLSFQHILTHKPLAAKLLSLIAMLDPQRIPEKLLRPSFERDVDFRMAIGTLDGFALITQEIGEESYAIHPLVRASVHYWLEQRGEKAGYAGQALRLLAEEFPIGEHEHKETCESMLAHAQTVLCYDLTSDEDLEYRAYLLYSVGRLNHQQGRYNSAHQAASEAYDINRERLGGDVTITLNCLTLLGLVLQSQSKYEVAEEMFQRVLEGSEKLLGVGHPDTLVSVSNLASVLQDQGKYEMAEELNRRALKEREKVLGVEHPDTLTSVGNLASVLRDQGKYEMAEKLNRRALKEREKVLGVEHPSTLTSVGNLALVLRDQGKYEMAEELNRRALKGREESLGVEHPDTLSSAYNLAHLFHIQQRYDEAYVLYLRALAGRSKTLGPDHPDTRRCSRHYDSMVQEMRSHGREF